MPIHTAGKIRPVRGGRRRGRLTPRRLAGLVLLAIAVVLLIIVVLVAALNT